MQRSEDLGSPISLQQAAFKWSNISRKDYGNLILTGPLKQPTHFNEHLIHMQISVISIRRVLAELRRPEGHHNYRKRTTCIHRNRNPCNSLFMVNMASGMDHGRVRPTTTTTNDVAQRSGPPANTPSHAVLDYSIYL